MGAAAVLDAGLEERVATIAGQLNALHAQLVDLVVEADDSGAWSVAGVRSLAHWLTWKVGVSRTTAAELVRLARARSTHPHCSALFADGALSFDQAAAAVLAPVHSDREMAELAPLSTVAQIRTEVRCAETTLPPAPAPAPLVVEPERVVVRRLAGGRWGVEAELDADHGAVVNAALDAARDRLFHDGRPLVTWVDAFVEMASASLDADQPRGDRFRVNVYVDPTADVRSQWTDGSRVPQWLDDLLACDGTVSPVFTDGAKPVSVGRTRRTVPERTRRVVTHRDRGRCRVPWCEHRRWLQVHHLDEWVRHDGPTDTDNLASLCPWCHRALHRGEFSISGDADDPHGLMFRSPDGSVIEPGSRPKRPTGPAAMPVRSYEHPLGERLDTASLFFSDPPAADGRHGDAA